MIDLVDVESIVNLGPVPAYSLEVGDQAIIDGDYVEIQRIDGTDDVDEVVIVGYSHVEGDTVQYSLYADDEYNLWSV